MTWNVTESHIKYNTQKFTPILSAGKQFTLKINTLDQYLIE